MQNVKDYWPLVLFCLGVISTLAVAIYRLKMAEAHIKNHCEALDKIADQFTKHLTTEGIHNTANDRKAQDEYRQSVKEALERLERGQEGILRECMRRGTLRIE